MTKYHIINEHKINWRTLPNLPQNKDLFPYARNNRKKMPISEVAFWRQVNKKQFFGIDFSRQYIVGNYILDFYIRSLGIAIEIDGGYHNDRVEYDNQRDDYLASLGIITFRISNYDAENNLDWVLNKLKDFIIEHFEES